MLSKRVVEEVLGNAMRSGGDFAEIFFEDTINNSIEMVNGKVEKSITGRVHGAGIRIYKGLNSIYAYTNDTSLKSLIETAHKAASAVGDIKGVVNLDINVTERVNTNIHPVIYVPSSVSAARKIERMREASAAIKEYSDEIVQAMVYFGDNDQRVLIANTEGLYTTDRRIRNRMFLISVASDGKENQTGTQGPGALRGFEMFEELDLRSLGREASRISTTMLHAEACPAGKMPVIIDNGFGGVVFHEACGHSLEATSVAKGNSVFCDKIGEQIASTKVTAIDDGTLANEWGSINIDDEGTPGRKNILIEDGILKGYLVDRLNGRRMNMESTGSARRESYKYAPTSRMTNTFIAPGNDDEKDIIKSIDNGLYAKKMGGGSVNTVTGEFNFSVQEGYMIKNGEIDRPVRGATLIGKGADILMNIDMVGKNLDHGQGMCGSSSGSVPTNLGQPMIRVSEITVGGR
ncbi:TldD/PmbA family protein [Oceanirhabdus sp. W0125-5]|uniref:TldD/PmbA family protein n=1 Tax=Oceanirhabdus sp. W0125-5 TaxID=2999116 RepID=UPI0022F32FCA|nr:TldD/PmbA family protein [Oceanirhabdus sp. W0125-5]WBW97523.1 TldD/PmbA family protein [Oceanirhabdus sp. W0125-5]